MRARLWQVALLVSEVIGVEIYHQVLVQEGEPISRLYAPCLQTPRATWCAA
jgi:hypothetical protein